MKLETIKMIAEELGENIYFYNGIYRKENYEPAGNYFLEPPTEPKKVQMHGINTKGGPLYYTLVQHPGIMSPKGIIKMPEDFSR